MRVIAFGPSAWDLLVLGALAVAAVLYAGGSWTLRTRGVRGRRVERVAFWSGWVAFVTAVAPPLDHASVLAFSAHMFQHELLMLVGAPLMVAGRPIVAWLWALPVGVRERVSGGLRSRVVSRGWQILTAPLSACALHALALWLWHAPALYERAVLHDGVHAFQHATFVGTAVLFWWGLLYGRYGRAAYGASALYVFVTMVHSGVLGAIFALSESPFYRVYRDRAAAAGVDAAADQQMAGLYMWIPAGFVLTAFGLGFVLAWLSEADRRSRALNSTSLTDGRRVSPVR